MCMCACLCVCVWWSVFAFLKHQFLGNGRRYARFSLSSFLRFGRHRRRYTSLTVTRTADADTVADYPTFVWLNSTINYIFSLLRRLWQSSFGLTRDENRLCRRAATPYTVRGHIFPQFPGDIRRYQAAEETGDGALWRLGFESTCSLPPRISFRCRNPSCLFKVIVLSAGLPS